MPEISITGTVDDLDTEDELFSTLKDLRAAGWRGSVQVYDGHPTDEDGTRPVVWQLEAHIDDVDAVNGTRSMKATLGDKKVVMGSTITLMTQDAYHATYGGGA